MMAVFLTTLVIGLVDRQVHVAVADVSAPRDESVVLCITGNGLKTLEAVNEAVGELYTSSLIELGLILFFITFVVLSIARYMLYKLGQREGQVA